MAKTANGTNDGKGKKKITPRAVGAAAKPAANGIPKGTADAPATTVELRARVRGEVFIRLRVLDPSYTAEKLAQMLNAGNASWEVGARARYHRIEKNGKVIAEIELADEDTRWE